MLIGNGSRLARNPMRVMGGIQYLSDMNIPRPPAGALLNQWIGFRKTASSPQGANPHDSWIRSMQSGSMGSYGQILATSTFTAYLTKGGNIASGISGKGEINNDSNLTLIAALQAGAGKLIGLGTLEASMIGALSMAADLAGEGQIEAALGLIAWIVADILGAGSANGSTLRGDAFMSSTITSAGDLVTAQSCAAAVWSALAAAYNDPGTMGKYLGDLGAGADPWASEIEGDHTAKDILRYLLAFIGGKATGGGTANPVFRSTGDVKDRISMTVDENGNRTQVVLDGADE